MLDSDNNDDDDGDETSMTWWAVCGLLAWGLISVFGFLIVEAL